MLGNIIPKLNSAPNTAQTKKTLEGENLSATVKSANIKVPEINPNCTAEVKCPNALGAKLKLAIKLLITLLPANHKEVQQNCAPTMMGKIKRWFFMNGFKRQIDLNDGLGVYKAYYSIQKC